LGVEAWSASLGLERCAPAFHANDVDREVLLGPSDADLRALGITSLGQRKRLLQAIAALAAAHALEAYTAAEPVAWARFGIDRARALVGAARGAEPSFVAAALVRLRVEALRIGFLREAGALAERLARLASAGEARSALSREVP
jgi:hypothetical protein